MSDSEEDLQTYLDSFNKEIEEGNSSTVTLTPEAVEALAGADAMTQKIFNQEEIEEISDTQDGTYFVDEEGNYYFQAAEKLEVKPSTSATVTGARKARKSPTTKRASTSKGRAKAQQAAVAKAKENETSGEDADALVVLMDSGAVKRLGSIDSADPDDPEPIKEVYDFNENDELDEGDNTDRNELLEELPRAQIVRLKPHGSSDNNAVHRCTICDYVSSKRYLLSRHMKAHSDDRPYKCAVCERGFKSNNSLMNHVNTHLGYKPHACTSCDSTFTTSGELIRHKRYRHTGEKPHKCSECDYCSVELSKLRRHMRCHTGERPFQCPHCTYASPDMFKLKRHLRTHTGEKPYECDICHARFSQSNSLKSHLLIHSVGDKPIFQCPLCPTTCGRKTDLRLHTQKLHHSDHPIKCKRCGQSLPDRYSYKVHLKTHEGEKCYRCEICPYASISERHLESHMLLHTNEKPFQCVVCQSSFRQRQLLTRHLNLYHNESYVPPTPREKKHSCPHCKRKFTHKGNLLRHMEIHDPDANTQTEKYKLKMGRMTRLQSIGSASTLTSEKHWIDDEEEEEDEGEADEASYEIVGSFEEEVNEKPNISDLVKKNQKVQVIQNVCIKKEPESKEFMAVEDEEQYMVYEVIQCDEEDDDDDEDCIKVQSASNVSTALQIKHVGKNIDVNNCFGFEEDGNTDYADDPHDKETIELMDIID